MCFTPFFLECPRVFFATGIGIIGGPAGGPICCCGTAGPGGDAPPPPIIMVGSIAISTLPRLGYGGLPWSHEPETASRAASGGR